MANYCSNFVSFIADEFTMQLLHDLFTTMAERQQETRKAQLPEFIEADNGHFFYPSFEAGVARYESKWMPNIPVLVTIAEHYGIGFTCTYTEPGNFIYGEATYQKGALQDVLLDFTDFEKFSYHRDSNQYEFEGSCYESRDEILEILLNRKKAAQHNIPKNFNHTDQSNGI